MKKFVIIVLVITLMLVATGCGMHKVGTLDEQIANYISCPKDIFSVLSDDTLAKSVNYISIKALGREIGACYAIAAEDGTADLYLGTNMLNCTDHEREVFTKQIEEYFEANDLTLSSIIFVEEYA